MLEKGASQPAISHPSETTTKFQPFDVSEKLDHSREIQICAGTFNYLKTVEYFALHMDSCLLE